MMYTCCTRALVIDMVKETLIAWHVYAVRELVLDVTYTEWLSAALVWSGNI
jgi:hypothetical protein